MRVTRIDRDIDCVYAIGDVHGRIDLLKDIARRISSDMERHGDRSMIVLLGDMIDRGPSSAHVLDWLVREGHDLGAKAIMGNHERMMLEFFDGVGDGRLWLFNGGMETLASYGAYGERLNSAQAQAKELAQALRASLPKSHERLLRGLPDAFLWHGFILAHDIVDGDQAIAEAGAAFDDDNESPRPSQGAIRIVHGHRIVDEPYDDDRIISVDTGAYATGRLSCAVLRRDGVTFIGAGRV